jgi:phosphoribosylaminoimidazole carboxylase PurE protein
MTAGGGPEAGPNGAPAASGRLPERRKVAVLIGSASDRDAMAGAIAMLEELGIEHTVHVLSAHRTPHETAAFVHAAGDDGYAVFIAAAGMAAHLAGAVASHTLLPVIGVPVASGPLGGLDALLSTVQMPAGVPVATVAIGEAGARNAALLAAQILAVADEALHRRLWDRREAERIRILEEEP